MWPNNPTLLLLALLLLMIGCVDDHYTILDPPPNRFTIYTDVAHFEFIQWNRSEGFNGISEDSVELIIHNFTAEPIGHLEFYLNVFTGENKSADESVIDLKLDLDSKSIPAFGSSDTLLINQGYPGPWVEENMDICVIDIDRDPKHPFRGLFNGFYSIYPKEGLPSLDYITVCIDYQGELLGYSEGDLVSRISGDITLDGLFVLEMMDDAQRSAQAIQVDTMLGLMLNDTILDMQFMILDPSDTRDTLTFSAQLKKQ